MIYLLLIISCVFLIKLENAAAAHGAHICDARWCSHLLSQTTNEKSVTGTTQLFLRIFVNPAHEVELGMSQRVYVCVCVKMVSNAVCVCMHCVSRVRESCLQLQMSGVASRAPLRPFSYPPLSLDDASAAELKASGSYFSSLCSCCWDKFDQQRVSQVSSLVFITVHKLVLTRQFCHYLHDKSSLAWGGKRGSWEVSTRTQRKNLSFECGLTDRKQQKSAQRCCSCECKIHRSVCGFFLLHFESRPVGRAFYREDILSSKQGLPQHIETAHKTM